MPYFLTKCNPDSMAFHMTSELCELFALEKLHCVLYFHQFHNNVKIIFQSMEIHGHGFARVLCPVGSQVLLGTGSSRVLGPLGSQVVKGPGSSRVLSPLGPGSSRVLSPLES